MSKVSKFLSLLTTKYRYYTGQHLTLVQSLQVSTLMGTGDVIAQTFVSGKNIQDIDVIRTVRFAGLGFVLVGPAVSLWYKLLDRTFRNEAPKSAALKKMAADQLIFAPSFLIIFLTVLGFLQQKSFDEIKSLIYTDYPDILITNYKVWPFVQIFNFYYVPLKHRVLLAQSVALLWNIYLSWRTQDKVEH